MGWASTPARAQAPPANLDWAQLYGPFTGGTNPTSERVRVVTPRLADNGLSVPLAVRVDSPMTEGDHVRRVVLLSNSWGNPYKRESWSELFDEVIVSGEVGMRKPDIEIYGLALERAGTRPRGPGTKKYGRRPVNPLHVGRGARPSAPEAGALPETGRYRATFQKSNRKRILVSLRTAYGIRGGGRRGRRPNGASPADGWR